MATEPVAEMVSAAAAAAEPLALAPVAAIGSSLQWAELKSIGQTAGSVGSLTMWTPRSNCHLVLAPLALGIFDSPSPFAE